MKLVAISITGFLFILNLAVTTFAQAEELDRLAEETVYAIQDLSATLATSENSLSDFAIRRGQFQTLLEHSHHLLDRALAENNSLAPRTRGAIEECLEALAILSERYVGLK